MTRMTREEAVNVILYHKHNVKEGSQIDQALDVAIHALRTDGDTISRQAAIDALCKMRCGCGFCSCPLNYEEDGAEECADVRMLMELPSAQQNACEYWDDESNVCALNRPSAQPDNRLSKIADLAEGTIDHFDLDDAMDLLYQIKEVLKNG